MNLLTSSPSAEVRGLRRSYRGTIAGICRGANVGAPQGANTAIPHATNARKHPSAEVRGLRRSYIYPRATPSSTPSIFAASTLRS